MPLMSTSWNLYKNLQLSLSPVDAAQPPQLAKAMHQKEEAETSVMQPYFEQLFILPHPFSPHIHPHILDIIIHMLCIIPPVPQLPTYPLLLSVLYHCGIVYPWMLFVLPICPLLKSLLIYRELRSVYFYWSLHISCQIFTVFVGVPFFIWFYFGQPIVSLDSWLGGYFPFYSSMYRTCIKKKHLIVARLHCHKSVR